ncbi:reverse transcriptase [Elysia marginata]|uniref:Reverse transcriptase n=1 Tax=Elysia marginata TaxID=1093978 RepID=A0AAV4JS15_9GAST|nr:reverse transcriptase [Elysia marginata]
MTYGQEVYGQTHKNKTKRLDQIQAASLRCLTGANKATRWATLQVATKIEPLHLRRKKARLNYWTRTKINPTNPAKEVYRNPITQTSSAKIRNLSPARTSAAWQTFKDLQDINIKEIDIISRTPTIPPWTLQPINTDICLSTTLEKKADTSEKLRTTALEHIENIYPNHLKIYTDGSKKEDAVSIGIHSKDLNIEISKRITNNSSITTAELIAIREGLQEVKNKGSNQGNIVILSDSLSATTSLRNLEEKHSRPDITEEITHIAQELKEQRQIEITMCWIPSHCDIKGNEMADQRAKEGLENENIINTKLGKKEIQSIINGKIKEEWQEEWDKCKSTQFYKIFPTIGSVKIKFTEDDTIINRARFGSLLKKDTKLKCEFCGIQPLRLEHISWKTEKNTQE